MNPGAGCPGPAGKLESLTSSAATSSMSVVSAVVTATSPNSASGTAASAHVSTAQGGDGQNCHTHADRSLLCEYVARMSPDFP